jgi:hypothetical protein
MSTLRDQYFKTLKIDKSDTLKRRRALNRAYSLRTFEIEHYWKRATYFWGFQIAIFAAFGLLWKAQTDNGWGPITLALAMLGTLTAVANYLSAFGSKFWQENWEHHIDMLEDELEGRLHKTVWLSEGKISYSVSGINQSLSCLFILFWLFVTFYVAYNFVGAPPLESDHLRNLFAWLQLIIIIVLLPFGVIWLRCHTSRLRGTRPTTDGKHGAPINRCPTANLFFIRRYAPDEPNKDEESEGA